MNKKQFEEIEDRIREAAENVSPPFSEENWEKMSLLLDEEYPQKRRKRALLFWLLPILGLAVAGGVLYSRVWNGDPENFSSAGGINKKPTHIEKTAEQHITNAESAHTNIPEDPYFKHTNTNSAGPVSKTVTIPGRNMLTGNYQGGKHPPLQENVSLLNPLGGQTGVSLAGVDKVSSKMPDTKAEGDSLQAKSIKNSTVKFIKLPPADSASKLQDVTNIPNRKDRIKTSGFYFIAGGSFVNNSAVSVHSNNISGEYGISAGYRINKKLSVQTGFFAGKKKYKADKNDYYITPGSYYSTVDNLAINADCYVLDIPVSVRYDFIQSNKYALYGTAGLSSYVMKRETYVYSYTKNGLTHESERTYTGNSYLLSIANLSAGYERKLNHNLSLLVEPYLKVPLSGIGEGKVKLYSTGLLLGIKYSLPTKSK